MKKYTYCNKIPLLSKTARMKQERPWVWPKSKSQKRPRTPEPFTPLKSLKRNWKKGGVTEPLRSKAVFYEEVIDTRMNRY